MRLIGMSSTKASSKSLNSNEEWEVGSYNSSMEDCHNIEKEGV